MACGKKNCTPKSGGAKKSGAKKTQKKKSGDVEVTQELLQKQSRLRLTKRDTKVLFKVQERLHRRDLMKQRVSAR